MSVPLPFPSVRFLGCDIPMPLVVFVVIFYIWEEQWHQALMALPGAGASHPDLGGPPPLFGVHKFTR